MNKPFFLRLILVLATLGLCAGAKPVADTVEIPYTRFVLDNGLTLIVHEDHKAPIVAVNVWYHVGSKNEKAGKTGFAHLFEHLMFNGSEHFNDDFFKATEKVGATDMNGTTSEDRTNYFENAPKDALDYLLWLESDRMGYMVGAINQTRLDEQRGVVQNEKRQNENRPYAVAYELMTKSIWPAGHPYSWTVIGSMEDLNGASLNDVHEWFKTYYGAANATLVVAGDVNARDVHEKVKKFFGHVPPGPPVAHYAAWVAKRTGKQFQRVEDRVPQARVYKVWNIPGYGTMDGNLLGLVGDVLSEGKTSRLYKRLVYDERIATDVSAYADLSEIAGTFNITATVAAGVEIARVEKVIDEELARLLKDGPTSHEVKRVQTQAEASFVRGVERIGGFGGKSDLLAMNSVFLNNPDYYKVQMREIREATPRRLRETALAWLSDGEYQLEVVPFPKYAASATDVDRSKLLVPEIKPEALFPEIRRAMLSNGLKIVLAERSGVPVVRFDLLVDAGFAADSQAVPGTARITMDMLDEGTRHRTSLEISEGLAMLGASLSTGCSLDTCTVSLNALHRNMDEALDLYADVILNPAFPREDFVRLQARHLAGIRQEKSDPGGMAMRVFPQEVYGSGHPYGVPFSGSGMEADVAKLTPADLSRFYQTWFRPNNATLIVVGDTTLAEVTPKLERLLGGWKSGAVPAKQVGRVAPQEKPVVYLVDRPGSIQSMIIVGNLAPPRAESNDDAIGMMNKLLGGDFTSRINMNLREDKHWTYGARTSLNSARGQRLFWAHAAVQSDKTKETIAELTKELDGIVGSRPVTEAEFARVVKNQTLKMPGSWETQGSVEGALSEIVSFGLPDDYFQTLPSRLQKLSREDVDKAAKTVVQANRLVWVVVGDRAKIEAGIRALNVGEIRLVDADAKPVSK